MGGLKVDKLQEDVRAEDAELARIINNALGPEVKDHQASVALAIAQLKATQAVHERLGDLIVLTGRMAT